MTSHITHRRPGTIGLGRLWALQERPAGRPARRGFFGRLRIATADLRRGRI